MVAITLHTKTKNSFTLVLSSFYSLIISCFILPLISLCPVFSASRITPNTLVYAIQGVPKVMNQSKTHFQSKESCNMSLSDYLLFKSYSCCFFLIFENLYFVH